MIGEPQPLIACAHLAPPPRSVDETLQLHAEAVEVHEVSEREPREVEVVEKPEGREVFFQSRIANPWRKGAANYSPSGDRLSLLKSRTGSEWLAPAGFGAGE
jgi:hypothetical protein